MIAGKQKQFLGAWRNYRGTAESPDNEAEKANKENANDDKEKVHVHGTYILSPSMVHVYLYVIHHD